MEPQKALYEELSSTSGLRSETSLRDESRRRTGAEGSLRSDFDFTQTSGHQDQPSSSVILNIIRMYENCRGRKGKEGEKSVRSIVSIRNHEDAFDHHYSF